MIYMSGWESLDFRDIACQSFIFLLSNFITAPGPDPLTFFPRLGSSLSVDQKNVWKASQFIGAALAYPEETFKI